MFNSRLAALAIGSIMLLVVPIASARASVVYDLFLKSSDPSGISGTGTLTLSQAVDPTNPFENVTAFVTSLTFNIDKQSFTLGVPNFALSSVDFTLGTLFDITASASIPNPTATISLATNAVFAYSNGVDGHSSSGTLTATLAPAVPELSTWAMMVLGFCGLVGALANRRRNQLSFAARLP
jgi:hypothetical protein